MSPVYITNSADAAIWHAVHDGGLTMALSYQVAGHIRSGELRIVLREYEPPAMPIQIAFASSRLLSAKVRALVDLATTTCDWAFLELPGEGDA